MSSQEDLENTLETIDTQKDVLLGEALDRLKRNKDFKLLILNHVIKDRSRDLVSLLAHQGTTSQGNRPKVMEDLVAISNLEYELDRIAHFHKVAIEDQKDLDEMENQESEGVSE
tara:strand:+ start:412 stop:753 length:342 start_codon:yes stop_codon:yes gene_type:complete